MNTQPIIMTDRVVLFTDVHNFSTATHVLAERQCDFLQELYETLGDIVVEHQGRLVKYLGDGFLCVFAAGLERQAVDSALALRTAFSDMVRRWDLPAEVELEVGIDAGQVGEGVFGHRTLRQWDVWGEVVNRAARIGHHRGVAVTRRVVDQVQDTHAVRRLPDVALKRESEPLEIWEVERRSG